MTMLSITGFSTLRITTVGTRVGKVVGKMLHYCKSWGDIRSKNDGGGTTYTGLVQSPHPPPPPPTFFMLPLLVILEPPFSILNPPLTLPHSFAHNLHCPARNIFLLRFLKGSRIALMGSFQISTGSVLSKVVRAVDLANSQ